MGIVLDSAEKEITEQEARNPAEYETFKQSKEHMSKTASKKKRKWEKIQEMNKKRRRDHKHKESINSNDKLPVKDESQTLSKKMRIKMERKRLFDVLNYCSNSNCRTLEAPPLQICIDLQFGEKMSDKEISHLAGQLRRVYGANKSSANPVKLSLVNLDENKRTYKIFCDKNDGFENYILHRTEKSLTEYFSSMKEKLVYLTPDSPAPLEELNNDKVYVIGGLVDDSVKKDITKTYAVGNQIVTARLPIQEHCIRNSKGNHSFKQILTINQVFEIMLKYDEYKDWSIALGDAIPKRVGFVGK